MHQTTTSKTDWDKFRAWEAKQHKEFFLPTYQKLGIQILQDIANDTKTNNYDVLAVIDGKRVTIDEKARMGEFGDLIVEIMQCVKTGKVGWLYHPIDYLFYASWYNENSPTPSSAYLVSMPKLRELVADNFQELQGGMSVKGYGMTYFKKIDWTNLEMMQIAKKIV